MGWIDQLKNEGGFGGFPGHERSQRASRKEPPVISGRYIFIGKAKFSGKANPTGTTKRLDREIGVSGKGRLNRSQDTLYYPKGKIVFKGGNMFYYGKTK